MGLSHDLASGLDRECDPVIRIALLGSTGSIGCSALEIVRRHPDRFEVVALSANRSLDALTDQVREFRPRVAVLADPDSAGVLPADTPGTEWHAGREAVVDLASRGDVDVVINALVGFAGLEPTLRALQAGKRLALANKESLVAGGELVMEAARAGGGELVPIDSEHSAILQCMSGSRPEDVHRLILTASGGPFRGRAAAELDLVKPGEALRHPTWEMGAKITIDSASLANKALEVIEAHFLYGLDYDRIGAVVHPQSIIHSFVEFVDGSVMAQIGYPTMELPILYALTWPERATDTALRTYDPVRAGALTFEEIDHAAFPMFGVGVEAGRRGGVAPAAFNAANEIAVAAFLEERVSFREMAEIVQIGLDRVGTRRVEGVEDVLAADREARVAAREATDGRRAGARKTETT